MPYCPAIVGAHATRSASVIAALQRQRQQLQCPAGMGAAPRRLPACKRRRAGPRIGNTTRMSTPGFVLEPLVMAITDIIRNKRSVLATNH